MKTPSPGAIKAYSKEYDTQSPAGRNVHEDNRTKRRYAGGGYVKAQDAAGGPAKVRRGFGKARGA